MSTRFGDEIKKGRQAKGLSLRQFAEKVRKADGTAFSPQYLNDVEHGRRNPPDEEMIRQIAQALELDAEILLGIAGRDPQEIKDYLSAMPEEREVIGRLFRKAREKGFKDWSSVEAAVDKAGKKR